MGRLIIFSLLCLFWGSIAMDLKWPLPAIGVGVWCVPLFFWWIKFRRMHRAAQPRNLPYSNTIPPKVFWKATGLSFLVLVFLMVGASWNIAHRFLPPELDFTAWLVVTPFTAWGVIVIPLLVGWAAKAIVDSRPLKLSQEYVDRQRLLAEQRRATYAGTPDA